MPYDNTNRGVLFKNDRKREGHEDADYRGNINVDGKEYWLNAWIKVSDKGKYMSLSVRPKESKPSAQTQEPKDVSGNSHETVPF